MTDDVIEDRNVPVSLSAQPFKLVRMPNEDGRKYRIFENLNIDTISNAAR
jgi:hypothetical protein